MNHLRKRLTKFIVWGIAICILIALGVFGIPPFMDLITGLEAELQMFIGVGVLVLIMAILAGIMLEIHQRRKTEATIRKSEETAVALEMGSSEIGSKLMGSPANGSNIRDKTLIEEYNRLVQTFVATTMDDLTSSFQEPLIDIGHPCVIQPIPSAPGSVRAAYSFHKAQRFRFLNLLSSIIGGKQFTLKNILWGYGVSGLTIGAAYGFLKSPRSLATINWFVITAEGQDKVPQVEEEDLSKKLGKEGTTPEDDDISTEDPFNDSQQNGHN